MSIRIPYLTRTITGIHGYRRRVPDRIRHRLGGKGEIVKSFESSDPKIVKRRYAEFHAIVERMFAEAETTEGIGADLLYDAAIRSLKARGLPSDEPAGRWTADDRSDAVDIVLADAGMRGPDELGAAFEAASTVELIKLREVSTQLAIVQGTISRPRPTVSHALRLKLDDHARGRDRRREDFVRYERERKRIVADLIRKVGDKDITKVSRADARSFLAYLEHEEYGSGSVRKQIAFLRAMFDHGFHEYEHGGPNPWAKLRPVVREDEDERGTSFDYAEVRTALTALTTVNDELQLIFRILASTGARLGEISGLELGDVELERCAISLRFNSTRRLKNKKSVRIVPLVDTKSREMLRGRLSNYQDRGPEAPVFPRYGKPNGSSSASAALGKWLTKIKLRDPDADKPKTTHSLRHTFKDALRELGVSRDIANKIQGHTAGDAADDYGSSDLLNAKREAALKAWALIMGDQHR